MGANGRIDELLTRTRSIRVFTAYKSDSPSRLGLQKHQKNLHRVYNIRGWSVVIIQVRADHWQGYIYRLNIFRISPFSQQLLVGYIERVCSLMLCASMVPITLFLEIDTKWRNSCVFLYPTRYPDTIHQNILKDSAIFLGISRDEMWRRFLCLIDW